MSAALNNERWRICLTNDLKTYDPYDIWKTQLGIRIKRNYYKGGFINQGVAAAFYFADIFLNNQLRLGYSKQEYSIVRALSAQILHLQYKITGKGELIEIAEEHINWLINHHLKSDFGIGWGLDFEHPVSKSVTYPKSTPLSTITPYILEALISHEKLTNQGGKYLGICELIFNFFEKDIKIMEKTDRYEVTSYGPFRDRRVANSVSYTMYSLVLLNKYFGNSSSIFNRISRLYNYLKISQLQDGSWYYSDQGNSFIDCFHSCIILKNLIKTKSYQTKLPDVEVLVTNGYSFIKNALLEKENGLYRRFSKRNKPGIILYDLYDNAEMLQCAILMGDLEEAKRIKAAIETNFIKKDVIYSSINIFGGKQNSQMLRWAVMPYLYSLSLFEGYENKN